MTRDLLVSAAIGTLVGGLAAILSAPKSGERLRKELSDLYKDAADKGEDIADIISQKKKIISSLLNDKSDWGVKAKKLLNELSTFERDEQEFCLKEVLFGTAIGGIIGAAAGLLLAPKSGSEMRNDIAEAYEDVTERMDDVQKKGKSFVKNVRKQSNKWLDMAHQLVDEFVDDTKEKGEEYLNGAQDRINDIVEWAGLGYKVWQGLKKRR